MEIKVLQLTKLTGRSSSFDFLAPFLTGLTFPESFVSFDAHCLLSLWISAEVFWINGMFYNNSQIISRFLIGS
jgi:hypothetical protein